MLTVIKYNLCLSFLLSFYAIAMEPQQEESSQRVSRIMQSAKNYEDAQTGSRFERKFIPQNDSDNRQPIQHIRQFTINDYKKVETLFGSETIEDSFDNCPTTLKKPLNDLVEFSNSDNPLIKNNLPNRFIFVGSSGCGKTLLAHAIGYKTKRPYVFVKSTELSNSFKGSCPDIVNGLFKPLIDSQQPGLIILDEFMAFMKKHENKNDPDSGAVEHLWQTLDEAKIANPRLIVICTANDISNLPGMILTRFGGSQHKFEQPSNARREKLIKQILPSSEQTDQAIRNIVKQTKNISLRELSDALKKAQFEAAIRAEKTKTPMQVTASDILSTLKPILQEYSDRQWEQRKEKAYNIAKVIAPYAIGITLTGASIYITWYLHKKQAIQTEKNYQDSKALQRTIQQEGQDFAKTMQAAASKHAEKLQKKQYDDTHGVSPTVKQGGFQIITSALTYVTIGGLKWLIKEKWGIQL